MPEMPATVAMMENNSSRVSILDLVQFAAQGLPQMLDPGTGLFCYSLERTVNGLERKRISPRYSMMTILGLHRLGQAGQRSPVDINSVLEALQRDTSWVTCAGDLGLLLWTCAVIAPERLRDVFSRFDVSGALDQYEDGRRAHTMEVAWFVAGLAHCALANSGLNSDLERDARQALALLNRNRGATGIYGHLSTTKTVVGRLRGGIGSFADQVYPIYALSMFASAYQDEEAKAMALRTSRAICTLQGPQGEWWWHYNSATGRVLGHYPVYSVHQHAMGPMALLAASEATGQDFTGPIFRGLDWIAGCNALNLDMRDPAHHLIWRCFYQSKYKTYANGMGSLAGMPNSPTGLRVRYECRPYELGWLLYAFAGR